jgi:hypothetical protein
MRAELITKIEHKLATLERLNPGEPAEETHARDLRLVLDDLRAGVLSFSVLAYIAQLHEAPRPRR